MAFDNNDALRDYRMMILTSAVNLVKSIDMYTALKYDQTGNPDNALSVFRDDAMEIVWSAAHEVANPDDATFSENDSDTASKILSILMNRPGVSSR